MERPVRVGRGHHLPVDRAERQHPCPRLVPGQQAPAPGDHRALPTPDATGSIPLWGTFGIVALRTSTVPLAGCGTACATAPDVKDLVGYGATANVETLAAPALSNTTADVRSGALIDTDNNAADFSSGVPKATNSAGTTVSAGDDPGDPGDPIPGATRPRHPGLGRLSPIVGTTVTNVPGIVTAVRVTGSSRGYWFQDPTADADTLTSEGVFVYSGTSTPAVAVGDSVLASGRITEFRPASGSQGLTEIGGTVKTIKVSGGNALPAAVPVEFPDAYTKTGNLETRPLEPSGYVLDWLETHEGMRITIAQDTRLVSQVNTAFGELWITLKPGQNPTAARPTAAARARPAIRSRCRSRRAGSTTSRSARDHGQFVRRRAHQRGVLRPGQRPRSAARPHPDRLRHRPAACPVVDQ